MKKEKNDAAISIVAIRDLVGKEEFKSKTISEWRHWLADLEIIYDGIIEEITGSKYQSPIEKVERMIDNRA